MSTFLQSRAPGGRGLNHDHLSSVKIHTTRDVVDAEQRIFDHARNGDQSYAHVVVDQVEMAIEVSEAAQGYELSEEQKVAVHRLTRSGAAVDTLLGPPGTGKTTLLRSARTVWETSGYRVSGVATAAVAAHNLQTESGIESRTAAQLIAQLDRGTNPLTGVDVLVLDEANLTDDRTRARLYAAAAATHTKVVEVGDPKQLRGVGCGSVFGELHRVVDGAELTQNRRQVEVDERLVLQQWRSGAYHDALQSWSDRGRLLATDTSDEAVTQMVAMWRSEREGAPDAHDQVHGVVMLAATNEQVGRLNELAQAVREQSGEVQEPRTYEVAGGNELRVGVGDQVLLRINDRSQRLHEGPGVLNGYRGLVTESGNDGSLSVEWRQDTPDGPQLRHARLAAEYVAQGGVELGYAMTTHKAEGLTVSADWIKPSGERQQGTVLAYLAGMDNAAVYVAGSRHKGRFVGFAAHDQLVQFDDSTPGDRDEATTLQQVRDRLAAIAARTAANPNDVPVTGEQMPANRPDNAAAILARIRHQREQAERAEQEQNQSQEQAQQDHLERERVLAEQRAQEHGYGHDW